MLGLNGHCVRLPKPSLKMLGSFEEMNVAKLLNGLQKMMWMANDTNAENFWRVKAGASVFLQDKFASLRG